MITKDNKREAALNELSRQHLSEEPSLWRDALSPFIFLTLIAALLKLGFLT